MSDGVEGAGAQSGKTSTLRLDDRLLGVLSSVVAGDAGKEDIIAMIRREGGEPSDNRLTKLITRGGVRAAAPPIAHKPPAVPFALNGTLYDPQDIRRFDGQALHFVPSQDKEYMLVIDKVDVMLHWWRLARLAAIESYKYGGYHFGPGEAPPPAAGGVGPQDHQVGPEAPVPFYFYFSYLYEDMDFQGGWLTLEGRRGVTQYANLTHVSRGFLGLGDWNDVISSVKIEHGVTVLYEHVYFGVLDGGSTLTLTRSENYLERFGWNDRASSVEAF